MLLSGGVDPVTERNMTGKEIAVQVVLTAVEAVLILGPAVVAELEMAAAARSAAGESIGVASGRIAPRKVTQSVGDLRAAGMKDAHHVIQDAAVRDLPGYSSKAAPGVQLPGPSTLKGSPHYNATQVQTLRGGGTYAAERRIGYRALRRAGYTEVEARQVIQQVDDWFHSIGVRPSTPTRIPGNRTGG